MNYFMKVKVTEEDIDGGTQGSAMFCPLALAAKRTFCTDRILVTQERISIDGEIHYLHYDSKAFVQKYDAGLPVRPQVISFSPASFWRK